MNGNGVAEGRDYVRCAGGRARRVIHEYVEQTGAGAFGHSKSRKRVFRAQLGKMLRE